MSIDEKDQSDFLAGFTAGDAPIGVVAQQAPPKPDGEANNGGASDGGSTAHGGGVADAGGDGGDGGEANNGGASASAEGIHGEGVDTGESGAQLPPQQPELILDDLPEDLRQSVEVILRAKAEAEAALNEERTRYASLYGKVAPVQRQLDSAQRELARIRSLQEAGGSQAGVPAQAGAAQSAGAVAKLQAQYETDEWKRFEELYPEDAAIQKKANLAIAETLDAQFAELGNAVNSQRSIVEQVAADRAAEAQRREISTLAEAHPDWQEINNSDEFVEWFDNHSYMFDFKSEEDMKGRLRKASFVIPLLNMYKATTGYMQHGGQGGGGPAEVGGQQPQKIKTADDVALRLSAAPRTVGRGVLRGTGAAGGGDPGSQFMAGYENG